MPKEKLRRVLVAGQDGSVQALVKDDEGQDRLKTFHMFLREDGTPVYKMEEDPGIDQTGDPFDPSRRKPVRERWATVDQPIGE